jgi:hypothetical protein
VVQSIYIVQTITAYKPALNIMKYMELYSMVKSDSKVLHKDDEITVSKAAEPILKADSAKIDFSTKAV